MLRSLIALAAEALLVACASGAPTADPVIRGEQTMISAEQAFQAAHRAVAGTPYEDGACDIAITRDAQKYMVAFTPPVRPGTTAGDGLRVSVDAASGSVQSVDGAPPSTLQSGLISARRAFDIGLATIRKLAIPHDANWETTVVLKGDKYAVTFPLPEAGRVNSRRASYALQVWIDARTGDVTDIRHAS
jgi:hypothetical protein